MFQSRFWRASEYIRNIGISAHVDSGKTTLTERILFYAGKISEIHDIQGKDGVGCKMDHMELERERGITIQSAATTINWVCKRSNSSYLMNIIDTPGHVDFTIEVERALRVLDGAVMLMCGVNGVQSQSITVDRQMRRYGIPRLIFVNKLDKRGSDVFRVMSQIRNKLPHLRFFPIQLPIGTDHNFTGLIDLVEEKSVYFEGVRGEQVIVKDDIPGSLVEQSMKYRNDLCEILSDFDDGIAEKFLEGQRISPEEIRRVIREATLSRLFCPLLMGSAYRNRGVQVLLDCICDYLPCPNDREYHALDRSNREAKVAIHPDERKPFIGFAFKIQDLAGVGQVTYTRVYQGKVRKGDSLLDMNKAKKLGCRRVLLMHANEVKEIDEGRPGDIVGITGIDVDSGTTLTDGRLPFVMTSMFVPDPVMSLSLRLSSKGVDGEKFTRALTRFKREDPTFHVAFEEESKETIISGMGELHLEIYAERMRREYGLPVETGKPSVNYRETITTRADFNYTFKRQSGGRGLFGRVIGYLEPLSDEEVSKVSSSSSLFFVNELYGNNIPPGYVPAIEKGFFEASREGPLTGYPCTRLKFVLTDGLAHEVDSNELSFKLAAKGAFHQAFPEACPVLLEPIMKVTVEGPSESQAALLSSITGRSGCIVSSSTYYGEDMNSSSCGVQVIEAAVPLRRMFGYSSELRACTQGHGEFSMELLEYQQMPLKSQEELEAVYGQEVEKRKKGKNSF